MDECSARIPEPRPRARPPPATVTQLHNRSRLSRLVSAMAARSAMGFAAGALRQTVAAQARVAPSVVPRTIGQQTRSMGGASHSPSTAPPFSSPRGSRVRAAPPRACAPLDASHNRTSLPLSRAGRTEDARILHASGPSFAARGSPPNLRVGRTGPPESRPCLLPSTPPPTLASRALTFHPSP